MTRINTNVSSITARTTLGRSNADLDEALTRLSTGLRINSGKDDPAGLIASENLRRDIVAVDKAISNSERANQMIATADSALGRVSDLLNDIRGLVTEAANTGVLSDEQIAANQLQIDQSLEAIDRIAQITTFQGRRLLDGSMDFLTEAGTNFDQIADMQIQQANLGETGQVDVDISVSAAASAAQVDITSITAATAAAAASGSIEVADAAVQATLTAAVTNGVANTMTFSAVPGGAFDGALGNGVEIEIEEDALTATGASAVYNAAGAVDGGPQLLVTVETNGGDPLWSVIEAAVANATNAVGEFSLVVGDDTQSFDSADVAVVGDLGTTVTGADAGDDIITITASNTGVAYNGTVTVTTSGAVTASSIDVATDVANNITITLHNASTYTMTDIVNAIDGHSNYTASLTTSGGDGSLNTATDMGTVTENAMVGGVDAAGGLAEDVVFQLSGSDGSDVFQFAAGSSISTLEAAINLVKDSTGVEANATGTTLEITSTGVGTASFVELNLLSEDAGGTIRAAVGEGDYETGTDIAATVNGITARGEGNTLSINTVSLDLELTVDGGFAGSIDFTITGGGANFQLGPDVVRNQQARIGIKSMNTAQLQGVSGRLYQLRSGESASLDNPGLAAKIVDEVITKVTELRGRLGAFQRTTLDTNIMSLQDTMSNLTEAESLIRDADFAAESAALTRAQILVQSGTSVLAIANQQPQNVLALLR